MAAYEDIGSQEYSQGMSDPAGMWSQGTGCDPLRPPNSLEIEDVSVVEAVPFRQMSRQQRIQHYKAEIVVLAADVGLPGIGFCGLDAKVWGDMEKILDMRKKLIKLLAAERRAAK